MQMLALLELSVTISVTSQTSKQIHTHELNLLYFVGIAVKVRKASKATEVFLV